MSGERYVCSWCGADVGRYETLFGTGWMHRDGSEQADCSNSRGDTLWEPMLQPELRLVGEGE